MLLSADAAFLVVIVVLPLHLLAIAAQNRVSSIHNCTTYANQKNPRNALNSQNNY